MADRPKLPRFGYLLNDDGTLGEQIELTDDIEERLSKLELEEIVIVEPDGTWIRPWRFASTNPTIVSDDGEHIKIKF